ncbi:MAG: hypothetical protein HDR86_03495 [Bacteroides sp.]|nr:hypothetical protein [Bacteroides sp.]
MTNNENLNPDELSALVSVEQSNHCAERAYWWMKGVDTDTAECLGVADMVKSVLSLLQKVDNITMDISITIKNKIQQ